MYKKILFLLFCLCSLGAVNASASKEDKALADSVMMMSNKFTKNWEFTAMLGAQSYFAEYSVFGDSPVFQVKDSWRLAGDLSLVKWASPYFGVGVGLTAAGYKGIYYATGDVKTTFAKPTDPFYYANGDFKVATGAYGNLFAKAATNLTNLFGGFRANRRFEVTAYLGGGVIFPVCKTNYRSIGATFNAGFNVQFRITKRLFITASARGALISDGFNGISFLTCTDHRNISMDGQAGALAGISYKFGYSRRRDWQTGETKTYDWVPAKEAYKTSETVKAMIDSAVNEALRDRDLAVAAAPVVVTDKSEYDADKVNDIIREEQEKAWSNFRAFVNFKIDRWEISKREEVIVLQTAEVINSAPAWVKFKVIGSADKQTSNPDHNHFLSVQRADGVAAMLINKYGVDPSRLTVEYHGGVDYMYFQDPQCSRSVVITVDNGK